MTDFLPWITIAVLFAFAFIYAPLRSSGIRKVTPAQRRQMFAAAFGAILVAVGGLYWMASR